MDWCWTLPSAWCKALPDGHKMRTSQLKFPMGRNTISARTTWLSYQCRLAHERSRCWCRCFAKASSSCSFPSMPSATIALLRCPLVASRFAIVGPLDDPAQVAKAGTAADAFRRIAGARASFISRADSSGTHIKELSLWKWAGVTPDLPRNTWYVQAGADQAATLRIADERAAYALADLPTFTRLTGIDLRVLFTADSALGNPYTLYVIRSASENSAAMRFSTWAMADWRARLLAVRLPDGAAAFAPSQGECAVPVAVAGR